MSVNLGGKHDECSGHDPRTAVGFCRVVEYCVAASNEDVPPLTERLGASYGRRHLLRLRRPDVWAAIGPG